MNKANPGVIFLALTFLLPAAACRAESMTPMDVLTDAKLYFTAPIRWDSTDWLYFGGTLAAIGAAHEYDATVRRHFAIGDRAALDGKDPNSTRDAVPAAAVVVGTLAFATLLGDSAGRTEGFTMIEAGGFSSLTAIGLKYAAGRARPNETAKVDDWRVGASSFPSLHSSAAFAIGAVLAESGGDDYRWVRRFLGYGMAAATAYIRVHDNEHWLSDTVAGAAIGIATARFTVNRRDDRAHQVHISVAPAQGGGVAMTFNYTLH
jgi:membrane-associated phospholipid phosphatase